MSIRALHRRVLDSYYGQAKQRIEQDYVLYRFVYRPLSLPIATVLLRFGVSANQVTIFSLLLLLASLALMCAPSHLLPGLGIAGYFAFFVLDFVDGGIARFTGTASYFGKLLDGMVDSVGFLVFTAASVYSINSGHSLLDWRAELTLGFLTTIAALLRQNYLLRVAHLRREAGVAREDVREYLLAAKRNRGQFLTLAYDNVTASLPIVLPLAAMTGLTSVFIIAFFLLHGVIGLSGVVVSVARNRRSLSNFERQH